MATDQQIIDFLALGDGGADVEAWRRPGQGVFNAVKALDETWDNVHRVLRENREAVDAAFRTRDSATTPPGTPFHIAAGHHMGDLVLAGIAPVNASSASAGVWVPDADMVRDNLFTFVEIDDDDPNYDTIFQLDVSASGNGPGTFLAGQSVAMTPGSFPWAVTAGDSLWFQFGGTGGTPIPPFTVYIVFS